MMITEDSKSIDFAQVRQGSEPFAAPTDVTFAGTYGKRPDQISAVKVHDVSGFGVRCLNDLSDFIESENLKRYFEGFSAAMREYYHKPSRK